MSRVTVVVADDHYVFREGLRGLLASCDGVEVVGEAADAAAVVTAVEQHRPDVVVMDLHMPGGGGVRATQEVLRVAPSTKVLVLTMHTADALVRQVLAVGARGYLLKDAGPDEIIRAVLAVAADQVIFDPQVAGVVLGAAAQPDASAAPFPQLTDREREVLDRMARGLRNDAIAARLGISAKTVANHVSSVLLKLGVSDRAAAVARARDGGLGGGAAAGT